MSVTHPSLHSDPESPGAECFRAGAEPSRHLHGPAPQAASSGQLTPLSPLPPLASSPPVTSPSSTQGTFLKCSPCQSHPHPTPYLLFLPLPHSPMSLSPAPLPTHPSPATPLPPRPPCELVFGTLPKMTHGRRVPPPVVFLRCLCLRYAAAGGPWGPDRGLP